MSWRRWKRGLAIAAFTGLCTGFGYLGAVDVWSAKTFLTFVGATLACIGKDCLLYLAKNPADSVQDDDEPKQNNPAKPKDPQ